MPVLKHITQRQVELDLKYSRLCILSDEFLRETNLTVEFGHFENEMRDLVNSMLKK